MRFGRMNWRGGKSTRLIKNLTVSSITPTTFKAKSENKNPTLTLNSTPSTTIPSGSVSSTRETTSRNSKECSHLTPPLSHYLKKLNSQSPMPVTTMSRSKGKKKNLSIKSSPGGIFMKPAKTISSVKSSREKGMNSPSGRMIKFPKINLKTKILMKKMKKSSKIKPKRPANRKPPN